MTYRQIVGSGQTVWSRRRPLHGLGVDAATTQRAHDAYAAAQTAFNAGDYQTAVTQFKAAYATIPNPIVLVAIGASYERLGQTELARQNYQNYLWADPSGPDADRARAGLARTAPSTPSPSASTTTSAPAATTAPAPPPMPDMTATSSSPLGDHSTAILVMTGVGILAVAGLGIALMRSRPKTNRRRRA